ncbi:MAG: hypothetical protein KJ058_07840 [Thermoanaerobaculia bacterium]|nr:hypothetical protein [Thermoanaerobaculia bacterium]
MKTYRVTLTGTTPLLLHHDNIPWADRMEVWKNDPESKKKSRAGDDRSPGFRWIGCLYHDDNVVSLPSEVLMPLAMQGGMMVPVPGAKGNKNFKSQTQSGSMIGEPFWPLLVNGKTIPMARINSLLHEEDFEKHQDLAARLGFMLFVKRAKVGMSKHIRVRPRFDHWSAGGTLNVWDDQLTLGVLRQIWTYAGQ